MNSFLFGQDTKLRKESRILIINQMGLVAGLLVDEVYGLRRFKPEECRDEIGPDAGPVRDYLSGTFVDRIQRWNVFSVDKLVNTERFIRVV
jgi:twitching motility protein PilI